MVITYQYKPQFHSWYQNGPKCNNIVPAAWKLRGPFRVHEPTTAFILDLCVLSDRDDVDGRIWRRLLPDGPRPHIPSIFSTCRFGKLFLCILFKQNRTVIFTYVEEVPRNNMPLEWRDSQKYIPTFYVNGWFFHLGYSTLSLGYSINNHSSHFYGKTNPLYGYIHN